MSVPDAHLHEGGFDADMAAKVELEAKFDGVDESSAEGDDFD